MKSKNSDINKMESLIKLFREKRDDTKVKQEEEEKDVGRRLPKNHTFADYKKEMNLANVYYEIMFYCSQVISALKSLINLELKTKEIENEKENNGKSEDSDNKSAASGNNK